MERSRLLVASFYGPEVDVTDIVSLPNWKPCELLVEGELSNAASIRRRRKLVSEAKDQTEAVSVD